MISLEEVPVIMTLENIPMCRLSGDMAHGRTSSDGEISFLAVASRHSENRILSALLAKVKQTTAPSVMRNRVVRMRRDFLYFTSIGEYIEAALDAFHRD